MKRRLKRKLKGFVSELFSFVDYLLIPIGMITEIFIRSLLFMLILIKVKELEVEIPTLLIVFGYVWIYKSAYDYFKLKFNIIKQLYHS